LYRFHPTLVLGFHACDANVRDELVSGEKDFRASENSYDWLGPGMYFWENSPHRAEQYAQELLQRGKISKPAVVGAAIHLGYCFDLLEQHSLDVLKQYHSAMVKTYKTAGAELPKNTAAFPNDGDYLLRKLDCAVFQYMHSEMRKKNASAFDSVRGAFWEGNALYPNAGFKEKNHIQLCIRNPNCVKGFFTPRTLDDQFARV